MSCQELGSSLTPNARPQGDLCGDARPQGALLVAARPQGGQLCRTYDFTPVVGGDNIITFLSENIVTFAGEDMVLL